MADDQQPQQGDGIPYRIDCFRSGMHRNVTADGAWITISGQGNVILNFFADSPPLPKTILAESTKDGTGFTSKPAQITPVSDAAVFRQYEISVSLTQPNAKVMIENLKKVLELTESFSKPKTP